MVAQTQMGALVQAAAQALLLLLLLQLLPMQLQQHPAAQAQPAPAPVPSQSTPAALTVDVGWIVSGPNRTSDGLPSCAYCINVINAVFYSNWTGLRVGMYRCLKQDQNELWTVDARRNTISLVDPSNQTLCMDAGASAAGGGRSDYRTVLPLRVRPCDGSPRQRWFLGAGANSKLLRSNLTDSGGGALYLAQGEVDNLPGVANDTDMSANFNLYLSRLDALSAAAAPGFITAEFTLQPLSNFRGRQFPGLGLQQHSDESGDADTSGNLLANGGFERTTIRTRWPATQNCSSFTRSCSRQIFFGGELFSLCSWAVSSPPELVYDRAPLWTAARGTASLLLSNRASLNQTFPSRSGARYRLSLAVAGVLAHSASQDAYALCNATTGSGGTTTSVFVTAQVDSEQPALFGLAPAEATAPGQPTVWTLKTMLFTATRDATTITISSVGSEACGPVIDDVAVTLDLPADASQPPAPSPGPAAAAAPGSGASSSGAGDGGWSTRKRTRVAVGVTVGGAAALLLLLLGLFLVRGRRSDSKRKQQQQSHLADSSDSAATIAAASVPPNIKVYSYAQLEKATGNWSTVLGEGGFSKVYRGEFPDGTLGAVKVEKARRAKSSVFKRELDLFLRVSHRNLVNLTGFCADKDHPILVFEFLPNGSLYDRLHNAAAPPLPWPARMTIAYQLAAALQYLHHGTSPPIGHRDIKSANILLTDSDSAKLADFGLSKPAPADATAFITVHTDVKGSLGYLDPKYVRSGVYSLKSDVYSYGVVLLELITGQPAIKDLDLLPFWAARYINDPLIAHQMLDERLGEDYNPADLRVVVDLVKMCLQEDAQQRPSMQQVVAFLADSHFSGCPPAAAGPIDDHVVAVHVPAVDDDDDDDSRKKTPVDVNVNADAAAAAMEFSASSSSQATSTTATSTSSSSSSQATTPYFCLPS